MGGQRVALYPGSFDPLTNGHLDVIERASRLFDTLVVAVGRNEAKQPIFTPGERVSHLEEACASWPNVEVHTFAGLLADAVEDFSAEAVIRGLRAVSDFEWEFQMALMNRQLSPNCETLFLMPKAEYSFVSSTMIREIARFGGDISLFVPPTVASELRARMQELR
jgi:pantetheine-phosphate adenylyltransferase